MSLLPGYRCKSVVVVAPHPDDEAIGCGGTLLRHAAEKDIVRAIFLTSGEQGGHGRPPAETGPMREAEARTAAETLQISELEFWRIPDGKVRPTAKLVRKLADRLIELKARAVYVTHGQEGHDDHRAAARMVLKAAALIGMSGGKPPVVWSYEVWTPMQEFEYVVDISAQIDAKLKAVRSHQSQCAVMRFDEACLGLARYRGEMHSWPGGDYAEVFQEPRIVSASSARATLGKGASR